MKNLYRPTKIEIKNTKDGGFKVVESGSDDSVIILEFNPKNSGLPAKKTREFVEYLIEYYNCNYS